MSKPKAVLTVPKAKYDEAILAAKSGLSLLEAMEIAGALRLPFIGYPETVKALRAVVKR